MSTYQLQCTYCGTEWKITKLPKDLINCFICGDKKITAKDITESVIDYYIGCTPYEEKVVAKEPESDKIEEEPTTEGGWYYKPKYWMGD